jgi:hypothetical protein
MPDSSPKDRPFASRRTVELIVAALLFTFGVVVIGDSLRIGMRWVEDGPQAGYFPFYIGLIICACTAVTFVRALMAGRGERKSFASRGQIGTVLKMLVPSIAYVALVGVLGLYVASALYIVFFMVWLGGYPWRQALPIGLGVSAAFYLLFELWFRIPLPKGPLEAALGLD